MKLRTRMDLFSTALLSALGASSVVACGGSFTPGSSEGASGSSASGGEASSAGASNNAGATSSGGASSGGASSGGASSGGASSGGASSGGASSGGASSGGSGNHFSCKSPRDLGSGLIQCDDFTHRARAATCPSSLPRSQAIPGSAPAAQCKLDSECTDKPHGWCGTAGPGNLPGPYCNYGCVEDSECSTSELCLCGDPIGRCVPATDCATDADCANGFLCRSYDSTAGCGLTTFSCQKQADECAADSDCPPVVTDVYSSPGRCQYDRGQQHFACQSGSCAIGRPFLVKDEQRLAPPSRRADWQQLALLPRLAELDTALRAQLAAEWTRVALMEHASIAAFARFGLQLLSLGAPPDLVERTTAAMADETKHARACFAVASAYAGTPVGPGRLAVERSLDETSLAQIVLNSIREGCIGETIAAIEAREAAEYAVDPALRALLLTISEDETRHAELAFYFVKWALTQGNAALKRAVRREFDTLSAPPSAGASLGARENASLAHGILSEPLRQLIRARALREVILPCASALFETRVSYPAEAALDTSAP